MGAVTEGNKNKISHEMSIDKVQLMVVTTNLKKRKET